MHEDHVGCLSNIISASLTDRKNYDIKTFLPEVAGNEQYDCVICELSHASVQKAEAMLLESKTRQFIFNHIWPPQLTGYEEFKKKAGFLVSIAEDNQEIII